MLKKLQTEFFAKTHEVTEYYAMEMLESVPPIRQATNGFLVGEAECGGKDRSGKYEMLYRFIWENDGRHYDGGLASTHDFDTFLIPDTSLRCSDCYAIDSTGNTDCPRHKK